VTRRLTPLELAHEAGLEPAVVDRVIATGGCIPIATIVGDPALDPTLPVHAAVAAGRVVRHEGDVFRTAVNPAARLLSSAGRGLASPAADLTRATRPADPGEAARPIRPSRAQPSGPG